MIGRRAGALVKVGLITAMLAHGFAAADDGERRRRSVPEFDPATVGVVAAVIAGGGLLIARRGRKR